MTDFEQVEEIADSLIAKCDELGIDCYCITVNGDTMVGRSSYDEEGSPLCIQQLFATLDEMVTSNPSSIALYTADDIKKAVKESVAKLKAGGRITATREGN